MQTSKSESDKAIKLNQIKFSIDNNLARIFGRFV